MTFAAIVTMPAHTGSASVRATTSVLAKTLVLPQSSRFAVKSQAVRSVDKKYLTTVRSKLAGAKGITCVGHADRRDGTKARSLGRSRAKAVCAILAKTSGVTVQTAGRFDAAPTGRKNTPSNRSRNRRVDVTVHN